MVHIAQQAELLGYDRFMVADTRHSRDTYAVQAVCAMATKRIQVGCSVTDPYTRPPAVTAAAAATVDEISAGRAVLGIGAGNPAQFWGEDRSKPAIALREAITIIRGLWSGKPFSFKGKRFTVDKASIGWIREPKKIPILVTSINPLIQRLAGEMADIAMIGPTYISKENYDKHLANIREGAGRAGRKTEEMQILPHLFTCCSKNGHQARESVKLFAADALFRNRRYGRIDPTALGFEPERVEKIAREVENWGYVRYGISEELSKLIGDDMVDGFSVAGTPEECVVKVKKILSFGFSAVQLYVVPVFGHHDKYPGYEETLSSFAQTRESLQ